ncbi:MAG: EAL domain-containing protein [Nevskiales bacterium]|nr:EAL domain-containing protein [Nevskiales bacterium]
MRLLVRRLGRRRYQVLVGVLATAVLSGLAIAAINYWLVIHVLGRDPSAAVLLAVAPYPVLEWISVLLIAGWVWRRQVHEPLQRLFRQLPERLRRDQGQSDLQIKAARGELHQRTEQLNAMLQMNRGLREKLVQAGREQQMLVNCRQALLGMAQEALIVTDASGTVLGGSPAAATLLRCPRESLVGRRFSDCIPLYQDGREHFQDFPLSNFLDRVLSSRSSIPQIQQAILLTHENEAIQVMITAGSVLDNGNESIGGIVRINRADAEHVQEQMREQLSIADTEMQDWGTNLLSREPFERRLDELLAEAKATGTQHMMLSIRVDNLDHINDEHGYWAGEQALWHAAKNIEMALVGAGTGYRSANARFAALLIGFDEARAKEAAERIRNHADQNPMVWEGQRLPCTLSIAIVPITRETRDRGEVLAASENLLAEAKNRGGNQALAQIPDDKVKQRRREDKVWLEWLLPRMADGRAHLISQVLEPADARVDKPMIEFFIRAEDDDGVWLEPAYYLPAIERLHQSHQVDLWTLKTVIAMLGNNPGVLDAHRCVTLNLSAPSLLEPDFAASVFEIVTEAPFSAERLCFEIDEAFTLSQSSVVQRFMEQLRPTGVRFSLDRCQTTMGITQLRHLPIDFMKLHPNITHNIEGDAIDGAQLEWICRAAHLLNRKTVAISIESESLVQALRSAGVDYIQGSAINKMGPLMT